MALCFQVTESQFETDTLLLCLVNHDFINNSMINKYDFNSMSFATCKVCRDRVGPMYNEKNQGLSLPIRFTICLFFFSIQQSK